MGSRLIFLRRPAYVLKVHLTLLDRLSGAVAPSKHRNLWSAVMARSSGICDSESQSSPGAREKGGWMSVPRTDTGAPS